MRSLQQQRDDRLGFLTRRIVMVPEELFELVYEQQQIAALWQIAVAAPFNDRSRTARQKAA